MEEVRPWKPIEVADGSWTYMLGHWTEFHDFIEQHIFHGVQAEHPTLIWRGQRDSDWSLTTTLDRLFQRLQILPADSNLLEKVSAKHLESFQLAARGRRGVHPENLQELEWWALGQHFGLGTPLLDWTHSPYAAAYFAFEDIDAPNESGFRAVYGLDAAAVTLKNEELANEESLETGRAPLIQIVDSLSNENPRLVSQGGLFTRAPIGVSVEDWVSKSFEGTDFPALIKILIPDADRIQCLRGLDRMNINHASLFPDLAGASRATNLKFEIYPKYLEDDSRF